MKSQGPSLRNARELRKHCTDAELLLWRSLRDCQMQGIKFKRQQPIERYIVDFVAFAVKLIVEIDGSQHMESRCSDEVRDVCLRRNGFTVLRFWNNEVFENLPGCLKLSGCIALVQLPTPQIWQLPPHPDPPPPGGRESFKQTGWIT
jgi:very-short-patch-repair endonuclease